MGSEEEAVSYIYQSYLKAEPYLEWSLPDRYKRNPMLTRDLIQGLCQKPAVLVTGSKGKGSVACMLSQLLGTRKHVGLMTSPHLKEFRERFRVDGEMISEENLVKILNQLKPQFDSIEQTLSAKEFISPMGIQAALALVYFEECGTDMNVFECGKGVRYDDVNNIPHEYAVINTIFPEHLRELGGSLREIAENKAAIITGEQRKVYVAKQEPAVLQVIAERAADCGVLLKQYGKDFWCEKVRYEEHGMQVDIVTGGQCYTDMEIPLLGEHQGRNLALAFVVAEDILGELPVKACRERLQGLQWPGRLEVLSSNPMTILDACINRESCKCVKEVLRQMHVGPLTAIIGIPDDKDYVGVAEEMADIAEEIILTRADNPHYRFTGIQEETLRARGIQIRGTMDVAEALQEAGKAGNAVCILGTTALVAEISAGREQLFPCQ